MKKVVWGPPQLRDPNSPFLKGQKTFKQVWERAQKVEQEQKQALEYLQKAMPGMTAIFDLKVQRNEPFVVMRPLNYTTSVLETEEDDDGFYNVRKSEKMPKFVNVNRTIMPGTCLILKTIDNMMREYVFVDGMGAEHPISMDEKNALMMQTDVFETVKNYFEKK